MTFLDCLKQAKGNIAKARSIYIRARGWRDADWYDKWNSGVADEVEAAIDKYNASRPR